MRNILIILLLCVWINPCDAALGGRISGMSSTVRPLKIICIGDSITMGTTGSTDNLGWRNNLQDKVGIGNYDFVGSETDPNSHATYDVDHAGFSGNNSLQIRNRVNGTTSTLVDTYLPKPNNSENIVLLDFGRNDASTGISPEDGVGYIEDTIDYILAYDPNIKIFVSLGIPKNNVYGPALEELNDLIEPMVVTKQATNPNLFLVDHNAVFRLNPDWATDYLSGDDVHPVDAGFAVMAEVWYQAIRNCSGYAYCTAP